MIVVRAADGKRDTQGLRKGLDRLRADAANRAIPRVELTGARITLSNFAMMAGRFANRAVLADRATPDHVRSLPNPPGASGHAAMSGRRNQLTTQLASSDRSRQAMLPGSKARITSSSLLPSS